jgi:small conductance mechanosensitive channel
MADTLPSIPQSVVRDVKELDFKAAVTEHDRFWATYGHDLTTLAVNLASAMAILLITLWLAGVGAKLARGAMGRVHRHGEPDLTLQVFMGSLTRYIIIIVGLVAVLSKLGVQTSSVLAVLGAASLAVGLALQGALSNVAAGVMLLLFRPYRVGDVVEVAGRMGTVRALDLFTTELLTLDGLKLIAPNSKIFGDFITNYTTNGRRRVDVTFRLPPRQDLAQVLETMRQGLAKDRRVLKDPAPSFEATVLTEAYAEGVIRVWARLADYRDVKTMIVLGVQTLSAEQGAYPLVCALAPPQPVADPPKADV